jgi:VanZ family protein
MVKLNNIMKRDVGINLTKYLLWLLTILWILLIFTLSSQNGPQTAQTSGGIAKDVAEIIYQKPTEPQVNKVHFNIRKLAHVGLFLILGVLSFSASATSLGWKKKRKYIAMATASVITLSYGFFDEWHKQFIGGRHFQLDEAVLNMMSGAVGVGVTVVMCIILYNIKKSNKMKTINIKKD